MTTAIPSFSDAETASKWAKNVNRAASEWTQYYKRSLEGSKDFTKASKAKAKAQSAIDKAQIKIDKGRAMKSEALRLSQFGS